MDSKYRKEHIEEMQKWDLDKKINHSLKRIMEFYKKVDGKVYIAFSGGKDSTVLLHLVRSLFPKAIAVFSNTTNEYLEILEFIKTIENVIEVKPKMTFNDTVKEFGFPLVSKKVARAIYDLKNPTDKNKNIRNLYITGLNRKGDMVKSYKLAKKWVKLIETDFDITLKCCDILKKEPMKRFEKETGLFPIIGTQASESVQRKLGWIESGCNVFEENYAQCKPLSIWNEKDIWEYIHRHKIAYSSIYDDCEINGEVVEGEKRTGCAYCGFGADQEKSDIFTKNRFERLAIRKPKQYEKMMRLQNNGIEYRTALEFVGVKTR